MKSNKYLCMLAAAALLPNLAFASTDSIVASFERDMQLVAPVETVMIERIDADPLDVINNILNTEMDAVVASFDRDLYRESTTDSSVIAFNTADQLVDAINIALYGQSAQILASFVRDLDAAQQVAYSVATNEEVDPLMEAFSAVLWNKLSDPTVFAAISGGNSRSMSN